MVNIKYKNFEDFFKVATSYKPYPYQTKLATSNTPSVLNIPTGAGKTETAVLALWLWKRLNGSDVPQKLVYCLPMRVLVEQTVARIKRWLDNLGIDIGVELLLGGSEDRIEKLFPNKEYIIVGTQDMLVSGALNRGYGNSASVWPIISGLLNNDSMWIMDEVQIMGNALPTSVQMDSFRREFGTYGPHKTVWMSATINPKWMNTVNLSESVTPYRLEVEDVNTTLKKRNDAAKILCSTKVTIKNDYTEKDVDAILMLHVPGTITLIMTNTVKRAQTLYRYISEKASNVKLIHSKFRIHDRHRLNELLGNLKECTDNIIVSTQVLEAGVDISAKTLISEVAPWSSMVQRFGRCNRYGSFSDAKICWVDLDEELAAPYGKKELEYARKMLESFDGKSVSPVDLPQIDEPKIHDAVLRRKDIINLFDTTSDLHGNHTDVSRFVRSVERQIDVTVFWCDEKTFDDDKTTYKPQREELCSISIKDIKEFLMGGRCGKVWDYVDKVWKKTTGNKIFPGQTIMLKDSDGGYTETLGWYATSVDKVKTISGELRPVLHGAEPDSHASDSSSKLAIRVTLEDHTRHVMQETDQFLETIPYLNKDVKNAIRMAAKYHDVGKIHKVFQNATGGNRDEVLAKSPGMSNYDRFGFRHEVASTLLYLKQNNGGGNFVNLTAYLIMAHHGKVRFTLRRVYRSHARLDKKYLLGIEISGETMKEFSSNSVSVPETFIDMRMAAVGRGPNNEPSWTERVMELLDEYGPFKLAYLEALIRRADWFASEKENDGRYGEDGR